MTKTHPFTQIIAFFGIIIAAIIAIAVIVLVVRFTPIVFKGLSDAPETPEPQLILTPLSQSKLELTPLEADGASQ